DLREHLGRGRRDAGRERAATRSRLHGGILLLRLEPHTQGGEDRRVALVAFCRERALEVGDEALAERGIGLGPGDDLVQLGPRERELLRSPHPAPRGGWQSTEQPCEAFFTKSGHR